MADVIAPEYLRFITAERRAGRLATTPTPLAAGATTDTVFIPPQQAVELLRVAARRASGLFHATKRTEVVWVAGDSELAISLSELSVKFADGLIVVLIPVRCDQTGREVIEVAFAVGAPNQPAGLYASTYRRPNGTELIVSVWGESLVALAWQCVLGLVSGVAGAMGKDARGNVLVPVEIAASERGLQIVPMARHRFAGSSGLKVTTPKGGTQ